MCTMPKQLAQQKREKMAQTCLQRLQVFPAVLFLISLKECSCDRLPQPTDLAIACTRDKNKRHRHLLLNFLVDSEPFES